MNKIHLIGNLTRDPELRETTSGVSVCKFTVAVNRPADADGERKPDFFNCTAWRGLAESLAKYQRKGNKVCVIGSMQLREYEDKEGIRRLAAEVLAQEVEFLTPSDRGEAVAVSKQDKRQLELLDDDEDIPF